MNNEDPRLASFADEQARSAPVLRPEIEPQDPFGSEPVPTIQVFGNQVVFEEVNIGEEPSNRQRRLLHDLGRLHRSLRSPENLLDRGGYSRPFPPRQHDRKRQDL